MRTITIEEHFVSPAFLAGPGKEFTERFKNSGPRGLKVYEQLQDIGDQRVANMDAAKIDVQVLSLNSPGVEQADADVQLSVSCEANDYLAEAIKKHPKRYAGFASLPTASPDKAALELERCVKMGFKGANINGHTRGRYLDDKFFDPILERLAALNVLLYLHPTPPPKAVVEAQFSGFSPAVNGMFASAGWAWHLETAVHTIRLVLGGVFDRYPKLQVAIGHLGEGIPFMLPRLKKNFSQEITKLQRPIGDYFKQNVHYTFGGFNFPATFLDLLLEVGVDRIMFSVDYPYGSMEEARSFLEHLPVSAEDREKIAHGNAEKLLGL
jgi:uncharacterized protein